MLMMFCINMTKLLEGSTWVRMCRFPSVEMVAARMKNQQTRTCALKAARTASEHCCDINIGRA